MSLIARLADAVLGPAVPSGELPAPVPAGVRVRRCAWIPRIGGVLGKMGGPAAGVTLGRTILVHPEARVDAAFLVHELTHVEQWAADPLFAVKYAAESLRNGYRGNRYEVEAYAREARFNETRRTNTSPGEHP